MDLGGSSQDRVAATVEQPTDSTIYSKEPKNRTKAVVWPWHWVNVPASV